MSETCSIIIIALLLPAVHLSEGKRMAQVTSQVGVDTNFQVDSNRNQTSKAMSTAFKVMQWNILADGLSMDGFLGPPVNRTTQNLKIRRGTKWDDIIKNASATPDQKTEFLTAVVTEKEEMQAVQNDGQMSELIADSMSFKQLVVNMVDFELSRGVAESEQCQAGTGTNYTYKQKDIFGLLAACAAHWQSKTSFVYKGHEAPNYQMEPVKQQFEKPHEINKTIFEEGNCKEMNTKKAILSKCGIHDAASSHLKGSVLKYMNKYANALERFNRKWGLKYMIQASDDLLSWGSAAWEEEGAGFQLQPGRGQMLVDRIEREKPDILMMEELDHYRFFQDALANLPGLPYSSSMDATKYEYRRDFFNHLPEFTDAKWGKTFKKKQDNGKGSFAMDLSASKEAEQMYQKKFLNGIMAKLAYLPKRGSNAQMFHPTRIDKKNASTQHNDNDGVAIFWNTARFEVVKIEKFVFFVQLDDVERVSPGKEGGVCGVLLRDKKVPGKLVWALTTHVPSGDKEADEVERISMVTSASQTIQTWVQDTVKVCAAKTPPCQVEMVVGMDGNSNPQYQKGTITKKTNMANTILDTWQVADQLKLKLYKLESDAEDMPNDVYPHSTRIAASVNKMRGLSSSQPWKIGEYQCDRIDYVLLSRGLNQTKAPAFPVYNVSRDDPHAGNSSEVARVYSGILPTSDNPSDHLPMIVEVDYSE